MLKRVTTIIAAVAVGCILFGPAQSQRPEVRGKAAAVLPDLQIKQFEFSTTNDKAMKVHVANTGGGASAFNILRLTVTKINGISVGRVAEIKLPPLSAGKDKWLVINARTILPNNVSLESTTFKLNADATSIVTESDEANNEVWHNL